ncbi:hypothetical protein M413DRAFT_20994 [Hebeloma cylindrosporum]|uniref:Uncharacterized protein n=1 Tax=Hebeloma cylindrosporum TaxID=76867 RepID=A0A0C3CWX7_HEBCY|nr:hypothetical protein M413DRAFT_20994 [Hebeloma cylindrosporum h7]
MRTSRTPANELGSYDEGKRMASFPGFSPRRSQTWDLAFPFRPPQRPQRRASPAVIQDAAGRLVVSYEEGKNRFPKPDVNGKLPSSSFADAILIVILALRSNVSSPPPSASYFFWWTGKAVGCRA